MKKLLLLLVLFTYLSVYSQIPEWVIYKTSSSQIPFDKIYTMAVDLQGNVWCGNDNSGNFSHLACFDGIYWTGFINDNWVNSISVDNTNNVVWANTSASELWSYDGTNWHTYTNAMYSFPWSFPIYADSKGNVWIHSRQSLIKFDGVNWNKYDATNSILPENDIESIVEYKDEIWIATIDDGVYKFSNGVFQNYRKANTPALPNDQIYSLLVSNDTLWLWFASNYLVSYDGTNWNSVQVSMESTWSRLLARDNKGNFWLILPIGVGKYDGTTLTTFTTDNSPLETDQILSLAVYNDYVYIGTWGEGLVRYKEAATSVKDGTNECCAINIYPNPTSDICTISIDNINSIKSIKIFDIRGSERADLIDKYSIYSSNSICFSPADYSLESGAYYILVNQGKDYYYKEFKVLK